MLLYHQRKKKANIMKRTVFKKRKIKIGIIVIMVPILILLSFLVSQGGDAFDTFVARLYATSQRQTQGLPEEIQKLETTIADLQYTVAQLESLRAQNQELRALLDYQVQGLRRKIVADVVAQDDILSNSYILSKGSASGVVLGDAVVVGEGVIVGKIVRVSNSQSVMSLLTDPQTHVTVSKSGEFEPLGITEGNFGLSINLNLIPQNKELSEGDVIVTSGIEEAIPRGLVVGVINRIVSSDNELFKAATIIPLVDPTHHYTVAIIGK
jgi:rod shape-determining protein MreC